MPPLHAARSAGPRRVPATAQTHTGRPARSRAARVSHFTEMHYLTTFYIYWSIIWRSSLRKRRFHPLSRVKILNCFRLADQKQNVVSSKSLAVGRFIDHTMRKTSSSPCHGMPCVTLMDVRGTRSSCFVVLKVRLPPSGHSAFKHDWS